MYQIRIHSGSFTTFFISPIKASKSQSLEFFSFKFLSLICQKRIIWTFYTVGVELHPLIRNVYDFYIFLYTNTLQIAIGKKLSPCHHEKRVCNSMWMQSQQIPFTLYIQYTIYILLMHLIEQRKQFKNNVNSCIQTIQIWSILRDRKVLKVSTIKIG